MTGEEWARYVERLSGEWREFAQNVMLRVSRIINRDRNLMLEDIQRIERRLNEHSHRWQQMEFDVNRYVAQQDRLEERITMAEELIAALAEQLARLQAREAGDG
jgi:chromosome segregation ATPase